MFSSTEELSLFALGLLAAAQYLHETVQPPRFDMIIQLAVDGNQILEHADQQRAVRTALQILFFESVSGLDQKSPTIPF